MGVYTTLGIYFSFFLGSLFCCLPLPRTWLPCDLYAFSQFFTFVSGLVNLGTEDCFSLSIYFYSNPCLLLCVFRSLGELDLLPLERGLERVWAEWPPTPHYIYTFAFERGEWSGWGLRVVSFLIYLFAASSLVRPPLWSHLIRRVLSAFDLSSRV